MHPNALSMHCCAQSMQPQHSRVCSAVHPVLSSPPADYDTWPEWSWEKLDQNIPIDRKDGCYDTHWLLRSVAQNTFVNPNLAPPVQILLKLPSAFEHNPTKRSQNYV